MIFMEQKGRITIPNTERLIVNEIKALWAVFLCKNGKWFIEIRRIMRLNEIESKV